MQRNDKQKAFVATLAPHFMDAASTDNADIFIDCFFKIYTKKFAIPNQEDYEVLQEYFRAGIEHIVMENIVDAKQASGGWLDHLESQCRALQDEVPDAVGLLDLNDIKLKAEKNAADHARNERLENEIVEKEYKESRKRQGYLDCNCEGSIGYDDDGEIRHEGLGCTFGDDSSDE